MKKILPLAILLALGFGAFEWTGVAEEAAKTTAPPAEVRSASDLKTPQQKASYSVGVSMGRNFKSQSMEIELGALLRGIQDGMGSGSTLLSDVDMRAVLQALQAELMAKRSTAGDRNKKRGEDFLAANKAKPGVVTLPSGLQYKVLQEGSGPMPKASDSVTTHYRGTFLDGTEFDSSYGRGEPAQFRVGGVIAGWTEALQLMSVGSKWQLFVPSNLAYRDRGSPPKIGPNETLIFEVELLSID